MHPTAEGYRIISKNITPYVVEAINQLKKKEKRQGLLNPKTLPLSLSVKVYNGSVSTFCSLFTRPRHI